MMKILKIIILATVLLITSCAPQIDVFNQKIDQQNIRISNLEYSLSEMESKLSGMNNNLKYIAELNDSLQLIQNNNNSVYAFDWISLKRGENKHFFKLTDEGVLFYSSSFFSEKYGGDISNEKFENIELSKAHDNEKYLCFTTDINKTTGLYFIDSGKLDSDFINLRYPLNWFSWSPKSTNIILGSYYEADMALYNYDVSKKKLTYLSCFEKDLKILAGESVEQVDFDLSSLTWITSKVFKIKVNIKCNPYTSDNCYEKDERSQVKRTYLYTYDIEADKIINSEQKKQG